MTTEDMEETVMGCCGAVVWLPRTFMNDHRKSGDTFYCPNGHACHFKETTEQRLEKELASAKSSLADKSAKIEKLKDGRCPFCYKTVANLSGHIQRMHA